MSFAALKRALMLGSVLAASLPFLPVLTGTASAQPVLDPSYVTIHHGRNKNYIPFAG